MMMCASCVAECRLPSFRHVSYCVQIYGSTTELADRLRDPIRRGWLLEGDLGPGGKPFLPFDEHSLILCDTGIPCVCVCVCGHITVCVLSPQVFMLIAVLVFWLEMLESMNRSVSFPHFIPCP